MSVVESLLNPLYIDCPLCGSTNTVDDIDISITIDGTDICRPRSEGVYDHVCDHCDYTFEFICQMDVYVGIK